MIEMIDGCNKVGTLEGGMYDKIHEQSKRVYGDDGLSPAIHTMGGGGQEIKILDEPKEAKVVGGGRRDEIKQRHTMVYARPSV